MNPQARQKWLLIVFLLLISVCLLFGVISLLYQAKFKGAFTLLFGFLISSGMIYLLYRQPKEIYDPGLFRESVILGRASIDAGTYIYYGNVITRETQLVQYVYALSFLFISQKITSRYYIEGKENTTRACIVYSIATALLGLWAFPWGPIFTYQALSINSRGGIKTNISDLIAGPLTTQSR